jgi:hypothetical protein
LEKSVRWRWPADRVPDWPRALGAVLSRFNLIRQLRGLPDLETGPASVLSGTAIRPGGPRSASAAGGASAGARLARRAPRVWCRPAGETDDQPALHSFASGIRRDQEADTAGLALPEAAPWTGENGKIDYLTRVMYGGANFDLPPKIVLLNRQVPPNMTALHKRAPGPNYWITCHAR